MDDQARAEQDAENLYRRRSITDELLSELRRPISSTRRPGGRPNGSGRPSTCPNAPLCTTSG